MTMEHVVAQAKANDREAMARLAAEHYPAVFRLCVRHVGPEDAADAAQETFLAAQRLIGRYEGSSKFSTWLFGIALNVCRNGRRARSRRDAHTVEWRDVPSGSGEQGLVDRAALAAALRSLPLEQQRLLAMREVDGLTYDEIAAALGVPVGTVKSRLHAAFANLRALLSSTEPQTGEAPR